MKATTVPPHFLALLMVTNLFATGSIGTQAKSAEKLPENAEQTSKAWDSFNSKSAAGYRAAIITADKVIAKYGSAARGEQKLLAEAIKMDSSAEPPTGAVTDEQKETVHTHGLLNDVATCYFIKGKSYRGLGDRKNAVLAFREAQKLSLGRCWDLKGFFWSPAEGAKKELVDLGERP